MTLEAFLTDTSQRIQEHWQQYLKTCGWHEDLKTLGRDRVGQGKCLRPALIVKTFQALSGSPGLPPQAVYRVALALEMIHTYSLVHDDLPCMDDDDFRRGLPTAHRLASEATALLLGDSLLTGAFEVVAESEWSAEVKVEIVKNLARLAGGAGMVSGQQRDLHGRMDSVDDLSRLHEEKTGALFSFCVWVGALLARGASDFQKGEVAARRFGTKMGLLFQVVDDVLDAGEEGASFVKFLGLEETRRYADRLHSELRSEAETMGLVSLSPVIDRFLNRRT